MSGIELVKLGKSDYDEALFVLNHVFGGANGKPMDFEKSLPKMCERTDEAMGKHLAIRKDGRIRAIVGVYPLPLRVLGQDLMFSTVGNVATMPEDTGKGYMSLLLDEAMKELGRIGADASRLCGKRVRYNRYGFEQAGLQYRFTMNHAGLKTPPIEFVPIAASDTKRLETALEIHDQCAFHVQRENSGTLYKVLTAWESVPYAALDEHGQMVGYISASPNPHEISEIRVQSPDLLLAVVEAWTALHGYTSFPIMPHQLQEIRQLSQVCAGVTLSSPNQYKIINWQKVTDAMLKLKASYLELPDFEKVIGIEGYGSILLRCKQQNAECVCTAQPAQLTLSVLDATRYLFGPLPSQYTACYDPILPLPLSWALQDRV